MSATVVVRTYAEAEAQWERIAGMRAEMDSAARTIAHLIDAFADELALSPGTREALEAWRAAYRAWDVEPRPEVQP